MMDSFYQTLLGEKFSTLPETIRTMHSGVRRARGRADITNGASPFAKFICAMAGMPKSGEDLPVITTFEPIEGGERWTRNFSGKKFQTDLCIERSGEPAQLSERFGPLVFQLRITAHPDGVDLIPEGVKLWFIPLPRGLCPEAVGIERVKDGRYQFDVSVRFPFAGDVIRYKGWLEPEV